MASAFLKIFQRGLSRRSFLAAGALVAGGCLFPGAAAGAIRKMAAQEKSLSFFNLHTAEKLRAIYWREGGYVPEALEEIDHFFRDHRTEDIHPIDTGLLDLLHRLRHRLKIDAPYSLVCGYRSPQTNAMLRKKSGGVAKKSYHLTGQAVDIRVPGMTTAALRKAALAVRGGGVGYYPKSGFVHVDVGPVRFW